MLNVLNLILPLLGAAASPSAASPMAAQMLTPWYWAGSVSGSNTIDILGEGFPDISLQTGTRLGFEISAEGNGNNTLTVKFQQGINGSGWTTIRKKQLGPGQQRSGSFTIDDGPGAGLNQDFRIRVSRKIATSAINYTIELEEI